MDSGNNIVTIKFKVKDNFGTNYSDYSNVIGLNWVNIKKVRWFTITSN